ncbi:M23 family metallopeptidase [Bacteroides sp. 51]|uniref:M23 family metallopeptidase n=1 Tax=Bacteroides sp. 51 TaxID=2302938 RepID=UPI0013D760D3|nr:M23 family metallopeptidase [Bacteroides sp. 51]NDV83442.1 M23 family peptidase [Bacteroides sp. 51]
MVKLLVLILLIGSSSESLLKELANKSTSLFPIMEVIDLYLASPSGMIRDVPVHQPIHDNRRISSPYGQRKDPFTGETKFHSGIDYACDLATTVHATANGIVTYAGTKGGYGKCVIVKHRFGFTTMYAHLSEYYVKSGTVVNLGKVIGFVGSTGRSTGSHLHYEVRKNNHVIEPLFIWL